MWHGAIYVSSLGLHFTICQVQVKLIYPRQRVDVRITGTDAAKSPACCLVHRKNPIIAGRLQNESKERAKELKLNLWQWVLGERYAVQGSRREQFSGREENGPQSRAEQDLRVSGGRVGDNAKHCLRPRKGSGPGRSLVSGTFTAVAMATWMECRG